MLNKSILISLNLTHFTGKWVCIIYYHSARRSTPGLPASMFRMFENIKTFWFCTNTKQKKITRTLEKAILKNVFAYILLYQHICISNFLYLREHFPVIILIIMFIKWLRRKVIHGRIIYPNFLLGYPISVSYTHLTLPTICSV